MTENVSNKSENEDPKEETGVGNPDGALKEKQAATADKSEPAPPPKRIIARRSFFSWMGLAWLSFTAATLGMLAAIGRFFFPNVLFEPPLTFKAGFPDDYVIGKVDERFKESFGVWLVRNSDGIFALSTVCTHLGCTPNWLGAEAKFKCPCHGSGFYDTGINFEGPAPRPLERYMITYAEDGQILINKNRKFQYEKGQWSDPDSFLKV
ncbi:MAG: ubiquinol-cytochrome c reductase iron-sulfur subunit [Candidatus Marinimicrobia bacterium]|nr:ubiquinol-cytochrome c reductase iron-sulfur subunit [Candidatus Neomarinimicrobiota bacterium]